MVNGTLFPCLDWRKRRDLRSVKHRRAGMNRADDGALPAAAVKHRRAGMTDPDPGPARRKVRVGPGGRGSESIVIPTASA